MTATLVTLILVVPSCIDRLFRKPLTCRVHVLVSQEPHSDCTKQDFLILGAPCPLFMSDLLEGGVFLVSFVCCLVLIITIMTSIVMKVL